MSLPTSVYSVFRNAPDSSNRELKALRSIRGWFRWLYCYPASKLMDVQALLRADCALAADECRISRGTVTGVHVHGLPSR